MAEANLTGDPVRRLYRVSLWRGESIGNIRRGELVYIKVWAANRHHARLMVQHSNPDAIAFDARVVE